MKFIFWQMACFDIEACIEHTKRYTWLPFFDSYSGYVGEGSFLYVNMSQRDMRRKVDHSAPLEIVL